MRTISKVQRLAVTLVALGACARSADVPATRTVVFSEMTVDAVPGNDQSWVELYNSSSATVTLAGHTVVCNDRVLITFPAGWVMPGKALLLLRFAAGTPAGPGKAAPTLDGWLSRVAPIGLTVQLPAVGPGDATPSTRPSRQRGYAVLLASPELPTAQVLDYVYWGEAPPFDYQTPFSARAVQEHLWGKTEAGPPDTGYWPVRVGMLYPDGEIMYWGPEKDAVIARLVFSPEDLALGIGWQVMRGEDSTPGCGNTVWPPPQLRGLARCYTGEGLNLSLYRDDCEWRPPGGFRIHLQIAVDPHFRDLIVDETSGSAGVHHYDEAKFLKDVCYYARVRGVGTTIVTGWSSAIWFMLVDDPNRTGPPADSRP